MKKAIIKVISFTLILVTLTSIFLTSCTIKKAYEGAPEDMRPINDGSEGAILYVPDTWSVENSTGVPSGYYSSTDRTMITLTTIPVEKMEGKNITAYFDSYKESFTNAIKDFKIVKENETDKDYTTRTVAELATYIYTFTGNVTNIPFMFRQAYLINPAKNVLYIITYSSPVEVFDKHLQDLKLSLDTFTLTDEIIPMEDKVLPTLPNQNVEGLTIPEGYKLISNQFIDYYMFVPTNWVLDVSTAMTAASHPDNKEVCVSAYAFGTNYLSLDDYFKTYVEDVESTFGNFTLKDKENPYTEVEIANIPSRNYIYTIVENGNSLTFSQYCIINSGYLYIITFSAPTSEFDTYTDIFKDIASKFIFK